MTKVSYYETGPQQKLPLIGYSGKRAIAKKIAIANGFKRFELVNNQQLRAKREQIAGWSGSGWYIIKDRDLF